MCVRVSIPGLHGDQIGFSGIYIHRSSLDSSTPSELQHSYSAWHMVYHRHYQGLCHICWTCRPSSWYRCEICGAWMGASCNWGRVKGMRRGVDVPPPEPYIGWHCLIETELSERKSTGKYAVMCEPCAGDELWRQAAHHELPHNCKVLIFQFVSHSTMW